MLALQGYVIGESLHHNTRSWVLRAYQESDQRPVILKTLAKAFPSRDDLNRWRQGCTLGHTFDHPHIIRYETLGESSNDPVLVIEDFSAVPLASLVPQGGFELADGLHIAQQVANGLVAIHRQSPRSRLHPLMFIR